MVISEELKNKDEGKIRAFLKNNKVLLAKLDSRLPIVIKKDEVKMKFDGPWADEFETALEKLSVSDDTAWQTFVQIAMDNKFTFLVEKLKTMGVFCCNNVLEKKAKKFPPLFGTQVKSLSEIISVFNYHYDMIAHARMPLTLEYLTTFIEWFTTIVVENIEEGEKLLPQISQAVSITRYTNVTMLVDRKVVLDNKEATLIRKFHKNIDQLYLYENSISREARYNKKPTPKPSYTPGWRNHADSITIGSSTFGVKYANITVSKKDSGNKFNSRSGKLPEQATNEATLSGSPDSFTGFPSMETRLEELRRAAMDETQTGSGGEEPSVQDHEPLEGKRDETRERIETFFRNMQKRK